MDEFSYLSVLLSVIIGLAVTEILQGFRQRLLAHGSVRNYWPSRLWAATILLVCAQTWWAMFGLRSRHDWTFEEFLVLLVQTILLYLVAGLVFPDFATDETVDLREHYFRQRKRFFGLLIAVALVSICRDLVFNHALPDRTNLAFHITYIVIAVSAILTANEWYHKALALFTAAAFVNYIKILFERLQ
ncbi:MAG: hypothetical protein M3Z64_10745 [Verrucomicrobiota bacterium]|nr:hypothetical protein [Verrucomicrobiota bacterium]